MGLDSRTIRCNCSRCASTIDRAPNRSSRRFARTRGRLRRRLTWLGARAIGVVDARGWGLVGYWLDWARVRGDERLVEYEALTPLQSEVVDIAQRTVRGDALDIGFNWLLPFAREPRLFGGVA